MKGGVLKIGHLKRAGGIVAFLFFPIFYNPESRFFRHVFFGKFRILTPKPQPLILQGMKTIYLAGPIYGLTHEQSHRWREQVARELGTRYRILDPTRRLAVDFRHTLDLIESDLRDIRLSDMIICNAVTPGWGTAIELWNAHQMSKKIIVIANLPVSPWLEHIATVFVPTVDSAIAICS